MDNGLTASDIALLGNNNNGMWGEGGAFMWIFALLILAGGGFNGFGNNNFANAIGYENLAYITMESSSAQGTVSEVGSLFVSTDNTHPLNPSTYWQQLNKNQAYFTMGKTADGSETTEYTVNGFNG